MIADPMDVLKKTTSILATSTILPPAASSSSVAVPPLPTVTPVHEHVHDTGTRTLWVVFVIMLLSTIGFTAMSWRVPVQKRLYHTITTFITLFAALSYFAMATGHGVTYHEVKYTENQKHLGEIEHTLYRQVFWQRYVDWSVTTPLLLVDLALLAGVNGFTILTLIVADLIMILTGLFAAFGAEETPQKWGWYTIACVAYLALVWQLAVGGRAKVAAKGKKVASFFASIAGFTLILWTAYPIIWGIAEGARKMTVDEEIISYAVLDVLAKPVFGFWLLFTHQRLPETNVDIGGFWAHGLGSEGSIRIGDDEEGA